MNQSMLPWLCSGCGANRFMPGLCPDCGFRRVKIVVAIFVALIMVLAIAASLNGISFN